MRNMYLCKRYCFSRLASRLSLLVDDAADGDGDTCVLIVNHSFPLNVMLIIVEALP